MPDNRLSVVVLPITCEGFFNSILGNLAVWENKVLADVKIPGAIAPPKYSPFLEITSKVFAVPKSITIAGVLYK